MKDARDMSAEEFDRARREEFDYVRSQIAAIRKLPTMKREAFTVHQIFCTGCDGPALQVFKVVLADRSPAKAICYRRMKPHAQDMPGDMDPRQRAHVMSERKPSRQLDDWQFTIIPDDADPGTEGHALGGHRQLIFAACECSGERNFTVAGILGRDGQRSTVHPPDPDLEPHSGTQVVG